MRRARALGFLLAVLCAASRAGVAAEPAGILSAAERSALVVAGRSSAPRRLDAHGFSAGLVVDEVLVGRIQLGARLQMAWEELSSEPAPRLSATDRVLVCLEPLPTQSIWRQRIPDSAARASTRLIAAGATALVRNPTAVEIAALRHYLAIPASARADSAGVQWLAELVRVGSQALSQAAVERLAADPALATKLTAAATASLLAAASDPERPLATRKRIVGALGRRRVMAARAGLLELARADSPLEPAALDALAHLDGELPPGRVDELLKSNQAELRIVAVAWIAEPKARPRLIALVREDPAPTVRMSALERLLDRHGIDVLAELAGVLADPDPPTRSAAAHAIGRTSGAAAPLRALVYGGDERIAEGAVAALGFAGPSGITALREIAAGDPRPSMRALAGLALGELPGHHD